MTTINMLWDEMTDILGSPGLPANAGSTLKRADAVFAKLDIALRDGEPHPTWWGRGDALMDADATVTYDALSEWLRDRPGTTPDTWHLLLNVGRAWTRLTEVLREGADVPEPWDVVQHVVQGHEPGTLYECPACESTCYCGGDAGMQWCVACNPE